MNYLMDICGTPLDIREIKKYRMTKVSYIFRPVFCEKKRGLLPTIYVADKQPEPYGMIIDQESHKSFLEYYRPKGAGEAVFMELSHGIIGKLTDKYNWNNIKLEKLSILSVSGHVFQKRMDEIPAKLKKADGQILEFYKDDEVHKLLNGRPITPEIRIIDSLWILTKDNEPFSFFDSGINTWDIKAIYQQIIEAKTYLNELQEQEEPPKSTTKSAIPKLQMPQFKLPDVNIPELKIPRININLKIDSKRK